MTMLTASLLRAAESPEVDLVNISVANAGLVAVLGYAMVFVGLLSLMVVVTLIGKVFTRKKKEKAVPAAAPAAAPVAVAPAAPQAAPGSAGTLKLHDVPPKTAAMLMAIVAHQMNKPLNELRFISIKEVK